MKGVAENRIPKIGEVYLADLRGQHSVQSGLRPVVVFQNNIGNAFSPNVTVLPMTSVLKKLNLPTHVVVDEKENGLQRRSMVLCENPLCIPKDSLGDYLTTLQSNVIAEIAAASMLASSAVAYIQPELLVSIQKRAAQLNEMGVN